MSRSWSRGMVVAACLFALGCPARQGEDRSKPEELRHEPAEPRVAEGAAVEHTLRFDSAAQHYVEIESLFPTGGASELEISMAVWTPGSYLVREFSRHVDELTASAADGSPRAATKVRKNRWRIASEGTDTIAVRYRLYARELTVRTNFVDADLAVLNGAPTFFRPVGTPDRPHHVVLELPESWDRAVSGLRRGESDEPAHFVAADYDELVDSPIVAGSPTVREIEIEGVPHVVAHFGELSRWDVDRSTRDLERLVRTQLRFWGVVPYQRYVFLNLAVGGRGGLEHLDSTLMLADPLTTRVDERYRDWLGLVSHELFHTWNVKRLRPVELGPFDYENEVYTRGLWVAEGVTSYYDDLLLRRAGLLDREQYLERLGKQIESLQNTPGRHLQSLADASFDAWIEYYRRDENSTNTAISYYGKGAVVAFLLDAEIRRRSGGRASLDDVLRAAYERHAGETGFTRAELRALASEIAGSDLGDFFAHAVDGTGELDYQPALDHFGLELERPDDAAASTKAEDEPAGWLGATTGSGLTVTRVERGTPAHRAGVNVGDELIALDDFRIENLGELLEAYRPGDTATLTIARRGVLRSLPVTLAARPETTWKLRPLADPSPAQRRRLDAWLAADPP